MKSKKLNAFTLAEMLVVLVVASLVIAMGFQVLQMVRKQVISIQKNYQKKQTVKLFETTLTRDLNRYSAYYNKREEKLILKNTKDSITYTFLDKRVVKQKDTIDLEIESKTLFLDGQITNNSFLDAIALKLSNNFGSKEIFVQSKKDASFYMNN